MTATRNRAGAVHRKGYKDGFRACEGCGIVFRRNPHHSWDIFAKKRFCSISCSHRLRLRPTPAEQYEKFCGKRNADQCWEWTGTVGQRYGYGQIRIGNVLWAAHRLSYTVHFGEVPEGLFVLHRCDNRKCTNPSHLFLGTLQDNVADMVAKGRNCRGERSAQAVLTEDEARQIMAASGTYTEIGRDFGVSRVTVSKIKHGRAWKHVSSHG